MTSIGMFEAKTHFAQFVDELAAGKVSCFVVTRRGKPVAEIIPPRSGTSGLKFGLEKGKWSLDDKAFEATDAAVAEMFA